MIFKKQYNAVKPKKKNVSLSLSLLFCCRWIRTGEVWLIDRLPLLCVSTSCEDARADARFLDDETTKTNETKQAKARRFLNLATV